MKTNAREAVEDVRGDAPLVTVLDRPVPHVLRTPEEYADAVAEVDRLVELDPPAGTDAYDRLELLAVLVADYDERHDPIDEAGLSPQAVVEFMAEQKGMTRGELAALLGGRSRLSDFLAGKRALSRGQIEALRDNLGIPADLLL